MTLRNKFSLLTAGIVILALGAFAALSWRGMEKALRSCILDGTRAVASTSAESVATFLEDSRRDIRAIAAALPRTALQRQDAKVLETSLRRALEIYPKFENGLWFLGPGGELVADYPPHGAVRGLNFSFREYFRSTMENREGVIGIPYVSARTERPVLPFTAYLQDEDGTPLGLVGGAVVLTSPRALGGLRREKIGDTGYLYIYDRTRRMILHPEARRILKRDVPPGVNRLFDRAIEDGAVTGETVNSRGVPMLAAFHPVPGTDWIVGAQQPAAEAYAPLATIRRQALITALGAIIVAAGLAAWAMNRISRPLEQLRLAATGLEPAPERRNGPSEAARDLYRRLESIRTRDEVGQLAQAFRELYDRLAATLGSLRQSSEEWESTFNSVRDAIIILDPQERILRLNAAAAELFAIDRDAAADRNGAEVIHGTGQFPAGSPFHSTGGEARVVPGPKINSLLAGTFEISSTELLADDGTALGRVHILRDITRRQEAEENLKRLAYFDPLTDLPNRKLLRERLGRALALAGTAGTSTAILLLDLDRFKTINDTLGHAAGDQLLVRIAGRLRELVQPNDTVARLGGDEFAVVLPDLANESQALAICRRILDNVAHPVELETEMVETTASIGVALYPRDGQDIGTLLKCADIAMYAAKESGKNDFRVFTGDMSARARKRMRLGSNLRHALEREEFSLCYQPQVDVTAGRVEAVEALLRWNSLELGVVPPERFIPVAEESELIHAIGQWVLRTAGTEVRRLRTSGHPDLRLAINVSARQLRHPRFAQTVLALLADLGLPPSALELDLREPTFTAHAEAAAGQLSDLHREGVTVALDDFGSGSTSLAHLRQFPIDVLKIDRSFIRDLEFDVDDSSIVEVVIALAANLGLGVIAEGVETEGQLEYLREHGCRRAQGSLFARPLPEAEIGGFLARFHWPPTTS